MSVFYLDPLSLPEYAPRSLEEALLDGSLPGIVQVRNAADREHDLTAYVTTYLEEEVRAEAVVRLGYVVCRAPRKMKLGDRIFAVPWQDFLGEIENG